MGSFLSAIFHFLTYDNIYTDTIFSDGKKIFSMICGHYRTFRKLEIFQENKNLTIILPLEYTYC